MGLENCKRTLTRPGAIPANLVSMINWRCLPGSSVDADQRAEYTVFERVPSEPGVYALIDSRIGGPLAQFNTDWIPDQFSRLTIGISLSGTLKSQQSGRISTTNGTGT